METAEALLALESTRRVANSDNPSSDHISNTSCIHFAFRRSDALSFRCPHRHVMARFMGQVPLDARTAQTRSEELAPVPLNNSF